MNTIAEPAPLGLPDAFGVQLHPGDVVTALFRGPELRPVLIRGIVVGAEDGHVLVEPAANGGALLDGTMLTAGEAFTAEPSLVIRQGELIPCTVFGAEPVQARPPPRPRVRPRLQGHRGLRPRGHVP